jgi:2-polyprenyl-3-methyl-5-hydroxy-6-metoxy-1,4-benzoquinol methylase
LGALANRTEYQRKLLLQHVSGRVLDVGSGSGEYLAHLSRKASHVVCLEPLARLHPALRQKAAEFGFADYQITILSETIEEYTASNPGSSFDWVLLGNVLCHVEDVSCTLRQVDMLLRPGGHVYFSEHLGSKTICTRRFQNLLNPWWRRISGGCNCNRDSLDMIERMESWDVASWQMENLKVGMGPFVMGLARKVETGA